MPIYEYECLACGRIASFLEKSAAKAAPGRACEACGSKKTRKLFSTFNAKVGASRPAASSAGGCGESCSNRACPMAG